MRICSVLAIVFFSSAAPALSQTTSRGEDTTSKRDEASTKDKDFGGTARDLLLRSAAERELLLQYEVECVVKGKLSDISNLNRGWRTDENSTTVIRFEYSRVDDHYVTCARNGKNDSSPWFIIGRSRNFSLYGKSNENLRIRELDSKGGANARRPTPDQKTELRIFDPRILGLTFCAEIMSAKSFEWQVSQMLEHNFRGKPQMVSSDENGLVESGSEVTKMVFDARRGYWPVHLDHRWGEITWDIDVEEFQDVFVPSHAAFTCSGEHTEFAFRWKSVNVPIQSGEEAIERLAKEYKCSIVR